MMRRSLLTFALVALAAPAMAEKPETVTVDMDTIGCLKQDDTYQFVRLMASGDITAAKRFYAKKIPDCAVFSEGQVVEKWDEDVLRFRMTCVRPKGEPECRWLPTDLVKQ